MACHRLGDKPLSKPMIQVSEAYVWHVVKQKITSSSQLWNFDFGHCMSRYIVTHPSRTIEFQVQNVLSWFLFILIFNQTPHQTDDYLTYFNTNYFAMIGEDEFTIIVIYICCNGFNC